MRLPHHSENPGLAALIAGGGFVSLDRFAEAVNHRGWDMHGVKTNYDHISVRRWLAGSICQNPDAVAAVLSDAWGVPIPVQVIWPRLRDGAAPIPAHLQPWVAARTLEDLAILVRSDMLTRRKTLTGAVAAASGPALLTPIARWLDVSPGRLSSGTEPSRQRIGVAEVGAIERCTRYFAATDAEAGGAPCREAAVGHLKYAVDLAQYASYSDRVGNRLLAAIAELSGLVGYMCLDSGMPGPAQRYLIYGLQAARESTDPRAPMLVVSILADLAQHMRWLGHPDTAARLHELAASQLPGDRSRYTVARAVLAGKRAEDGLCFLGSSCLPEVRSALSLSFDLHTQASDEDRATAPTLWHRALDMSQAGLSGRAAAAYLVLAKDNPRLAHDAEQHTLCMLTNVNHGQERDKVLNQIRLARIRFAAGEPEQACEDGDQALSLADPTASTMVTTRLRELLADSEPFAQLPRVIELQDRLQSALHR